MNTSSTPDIRTSTDHTRHRERLLRRSAVAVAIAFSLAGMTALATTNPTLPAASPLAIEQSAVQVPASFASLVVRVKPAVVNVTVTGKSVSSATTGTPGLELPDDPYFRGFFERFFRQSPVQPEQHDSMPRVQGVGSGFIVTADGYIVTSNHVIEDAAQIEVVLNDGVRLPAEVRGRDPKTDLALLKIKPERKLPYVIFDDTDAARPGDWIVAIGNPFGLGGTATTGIISARGRDIQNGPYDDYLQIDAPINRGNSGGPLFDTTGRVIGVNTAIYSPTGGNVGIGFAVPASQAKTVIEQLMARGHVERGWLGVQIQTITDALAQNMRLPHTRGALVASVSPDSPAARAGIRVGDVILSFNQHEITTMKDLPRLVADTAPGETTGLSVWRAGKKLDLEVAIARTVEKTADAAGIDAEGPDRARLGMALAPLTDEMRQRYSVPGDVEGAVVLEVESGSPVAELGIRPGDVIVQAGGQPVESPVDVASAVRESGPAEQNRVLLLVNRQGNQRFVSVQSG